MQFSQLKYCKMNVGDKKDWNTCQITGLKAATHMLDFFIFKSDC